MHTQRVPVSAEANQVCCDVLLRESANLEHTMFARKGRLYLLCDPALGEDAAQRMHAAYYAARSYDTIPSLCAAIHAVVGESRNPVPAVAAVVIRELEMHAVCTEEAVLTLYRAGRARSLIPSAGQAHVEPPAAEGEAPAEDGLRLRAIQRRLYPGDMLIGAPQSAQQRLQRGVLRRLAGTGGAQPSATRALQDVIAPRRGVAASPALAIWLAGYAPMPALEPSERWKPPRQEQAQMRSERERSPIWLALAFAFLAFAITFWVIRPTIPDVDWSALMLNLLLGEGTPAFSTGEAGEGLLPAPAPQSPEEGEVVTDVTVTFTWSWDRALAEDEAFDVRVAGEVGEAESVGLVREPQLAAPLGEDGAYTWTVAVVRVEEGEAVEDVSASAEPIAFEVEEP
ncbi:MAG: hypothetical protein ACYC4R_06430 [Anaerolineae bacterium]